MLNRSLIKRSLAGGLAIAAAGFPAVAQARFVEDPAAQPAAQVVNLPSAHSSGTSFQWGDAGIGAAGAVALMGTGVLGGGLARRRRVQRTAVN